MKTLECMGNHCDGAHCGLGDWYPDIEQGIQHALTRGEDFTTGWYGSKKEIASACITQEAGDIMVQVSVSNDFGTEGVGERTIPSTTDIEQVRDAIYRAWDEAIEAQKENELVALYSIHISAPGSPVIGSWIETYLVDIDPWCDGETEPRGWQEDGEEIPPRVKRILERGMLNLRSSVSVTSNGRVFTARTSED